MPWVPDADERSAILALIEEGTAPLREKLESALRILGQETLDVFQAAEKLGVSERTLRRWIENGELQAVRNGHGWRIPREVLQGRLGRQGG